MYFWSYGVLDVTAISFLSGCTVLSMTTYSVLKNKISGESHVTMKTGFPLAIGAAVGGLIGKWLFSYVKSLSSDPNKVGAVQALCLLIVTLGTLIYTIYTWLFCSSSFPCQQSLQQRIPYIIFSFHRSQAWSLRSWQEVFRIFRSVCWYLWLQVELQVESVDVRSIKKSMRRQWISCLSH